MAKESPNSFRDPYWSDLASKAEQKYGITPGLLVSVLTNGERSNANQVSEKGAATVFQITPETRALILKRDGIDPYLNDQNAAEAAALVLKDGVNWAKGRAKDPLEVDRLASGFYHAGGDTANWGPRTKSYINRVMTGQQASKVDALSNGFAKFMAANPATPSPKPEAPVDQKTDALSAGFGNWLADQPAPTEPQPERGFLAGVKETITGTERSTPTTEALPDWAGMPELNQLSMASAKTGLGTLLSNPQETAQIIKSNFPGVEVSKDEKGNFLLKSAADGQTYAIKPGFRASDIPRAAGAVAAFTPAGRAATIPGAAAASAGTQALIEASQSGTGGAFNPGEVAAAGVAGGAVPLVARAAAPVVDAGKAMVNRLRGVTAPNASPAAQAVEGAMAGAPAPVVAPATVVVPTAAPVAPMAAEQLAQTAKRAAEGGMGSKGAARVLAGQAMPDEKAVEAAKRLGISDYLQPDHVTTNQAYRELAQAVKSVPGSQARAAEKQGLDAIGQRAEKLIDEIGGTSDVSTLSAGLKTRMQATQTQLEKQAEDLYAKVNAAIPAKTEAPATSTINFLTQHADEMGGAARLLPTEKKLLASLGGDDGPVTYAFLDQTRKQIGQAMRKSTGPFADSESGLLKRLYSTLSDDQQAVANAAGAGDIYNAAKASVAVRKALEDDLVALFGKELDGTIAGNLSGSVRALPQGDSSRLVRLLKAVPEDQRQEVVASGLMSAFRTAGTREPINFATYAKWYEGLLRNKQAYAAVMSNLPQPARKQLSDLYRVANGISKASRERITTGRIQAVSEQLKDADTVAEKVYDLAKRNVVAAGAGTAASTVLGPGIGGAIGAALAKGSKQPAIKAADALIASPEFAQLVKEGAKPAPVRRFAYSPAFTRYVRAVGSPRELENREKWVLQVLQGRTQTQD